MLKYHLLLPAAVFVGLIAAGVPVSAALGLGLAAGCISMVVMMVTGGHRHHHNPSSASAANPPPAREDPLPTARARR